MSEPIAVPEPAPLERHPLRLPRGSVRATLVFFILLPFWILLLTPDRLVSMPVYQYCLLGLVLVFFASHGNTIATRDDPEPSPFYLPGGVLRVLFLGVTIGILGWRLFTDPVLLHDRLDVRPEDVKELPGLVFALVLGFGLGWLTTRVMGSVRNAAWFLDIQAWVSLLAILGLTIMPILLLIDSSLEKQLNTFPFQYILVGIVSWYFGARS